MVKDLLDGRWIDRDIEPLKPEDIAILYPYAAKRDRPMIDELEQGIKDLAPAIWITRPDAPQRRRIAEPAIKIQTIHSAKGLQYKAIILMWADLLPKTFGETTEEEERKLMYVALTRPEDYLSITASGSSSFISEISESGKAELG